MQKQLLYILAGLCVLIGALAASAKPNRVVLGYSASWRDAQSPPASYNFDAVTYIARAFLTPHPDGTIETPEGYFNDSLHQLARAHGVKLLLSVGGEASNADNWLAMARNHGAFERFCDALDRLLVEHDYDGIDIDWEPSATNSEDAEAYDGFMRRLRERFPNRGITAALGASEYWIGHFDWKQIIASVDYVNVMTYDYSGGWGGRADYASNLFPPGAYAPQPTLSVSEGMANLIGNHQVPASKLLLGITFWPSRFSVDHIGDRFPVNGTGFSMNITFAQAMALAGTGRYTSYWDEKASMPYLERKLGGSVIVYESPRSIKDKCEYADKLGCAGVMIWHLGADVDGETAPLMDAIAESCGAKAQSISRQVLADEIADVENQLGPLASENAGTKANIAGLNRDELLSLYDRLSSQWAMLQDQSWQNHPPKETAK